MILRQLLPASKSKPKSPSKSSQKVITETLDLMGHIEYDKNIDNLSKSNSSFASFKKENNYDDVEMYHLKEPTVSPPKQNAEPAGFYEPKLSTNFEYHSNLKVSAVPIHSNVSKDALLSSNPSKKVIKSTRSMRKQHSHLHNISQDLDLKSDNHSNGIDPHLRLNKNVLTNRRIISSSNRGLGDLPDDVLSRSSDRTSCLGKHTRRTVEIDLDKVIQSKSKELLDHKDSQDLLSPDADETYKNHGDTKHSEDFKDEVQNWEYKNLPNSSDHEQNSPLDPNKEHNKSKQSSKVDQSERTDIILPDDSSPSINLKAKLNISVEKSRRKFKNKSKSSNSGTKHFDRKTHNSKEFSIHKLIKPTESKMFDNDLLSTSHKESIKNAVSKIDEMSSSHVDKREVKNIYSHLSKPSDSTNKLSNGKSNRNAFQKNTGLNNSRNKEYHSLFYKSNKNERQNVKLKTDEQDELRSSNFKIDQSLDKLRNNNKSELKQTINNLDDEI